MARSFCVILRKAPYGMVNAAEALRHVNGGVTYGLRTTAIFLDDGVYAAKERQADGEKEWALISDTLQMTLKFSASLPSGETNRARILVHQPSCQERGLTLQDLVPGVELASDEKVAEVLGEAEAVLLY